ncbi:MAG: UDP-N-acetylmuramate dehydrogenase [Phycisphaeraceae bacterium]|nr:MAG: UDP-N-acetylmuramate dehydrogenase [Phycisphaeraceae bacterium]
MILAPPTTMLRDHPIPTWFKVGGRADRYARPGDEQALAALVRDEPGLLILGDGANLLVDDSGVGGVVADLSALNTVAFDPHAPRLTVGAGVNLPKLILETVRRGLGGLESLGGVPATVGGAVVMNAGGRYGEIADAITKVRGITRRGEVVELDRREIPFAYRSSGLGGLIVTAAEFALTPGDPVRLRERLKSIMADKKASQPLGASCAGCCFKNPTLARDVEALGHAGQRVSAGLVIDRAGLKGLRVGLAEVSPLHANFITTADAAHGGRAADVIELMQAVAGRVAERFGVRLQREVVVWSRQGVVPDPHAPEPAP